MLIKDSPQDFNSLDDLSRVHQDTENVCCDIASALAFAFEPPKFKVKFYATAYLCLYCFLKCRPGTIEINCIVGAQEKSNIRNAFCLYIVCFDPV